MKSSVLGLLLMLLIGPAVRCAPVDVAAEQEGRYRRLPEGTEISPPRALEGMALALGRTNPAGIAEQIPVLDHPEFDTATRMLTRRVPEHPSGFYASARTVADVKKGDLLLAVFSARAFGASDSAEAVFVFESAAEPPVRSVHYRFECEREWRRFFIPFLAAEDAPAGEALIQFHAGYGPQVLEIGGLRVVSFGQSLPFSEMPFTPMTYKGRRPDASWRAEAAASIEKQRKAPLTVVTRNSKGRFVPWHQVRIHQLQQSFGFGMAVWPEKLLAESEDGERYRERFLDSFNQAEINAGLDWGASPEAREAALLAAEWLRDYEVPTRSHALFAADGQLPADLAPLREQRAELRTRVLAHVREKVGAAKGLIAEWSVPIALAGDTELGVPLLAELLRVAREADPQARLLVHAGNVLAQEVDAAQQSAVIRAIRRVLEARAPVQGVALGSHFGEQLISIERMTATLDRFAELRLPVAVTDFEVDAWDEEAQADYTRDFLTAVFAHPSTVACAAVGLWAKDHPAPNGAFHTTDWRERPNARAWHEMVEKKWSSTGSITTTGKGMAKTKAFIGYLSIEVRNGAATKTIHTKLTKSGRWLELYLPSSSTVK